MSLWPLPRLDFFVFLFYRAYGVAKTWECDVHLLSILLSREWANILIDEYIASHQPGCTHETPPKRPKTPINEPISPFGAVFGGVLYVDPNG